MGSLTDYIKNTSTIANSSFGKDIIEAIQESEIEKEVNSEEEELKDKFKKYKKDELNHNLLQIPYFTWNKLPEISQARITVNFDPLKWGAIYVPYNEFMDDSYEIMKYIDKDDEFVIYSEYRCFVLIHQPSFGTSIRVPGILTRSTEKRLLSKKSLVIFKIKDGVLDVRKCTENNC